MKKALFNTWILACSIGAGFCFYQAGQYDVRKSVYIKVYPRGSSSWGPFVGECIHSETETYRIQEK